MERVEKKRRGGERGEELEEVKRKKSTGGRVDRWLWQW